jgi:hypothetical protein
LVPAAVAIAYASLSSYRSGAAMSAAEPVMRALDAVQRVLRPLIPRPYTKGSPAWNFLSCRG